MRTKKVVSIISAFLFILFNVSCTAFDTFFNFNSYSNSEEEACIIDKEQASSSSNSSETSSYPNLSGSSDIENDKIEKEQYMKIEFFGDSITVGTYTSQGSAYPDAIAKKGYTHYLAEYFQCEEMQNHAINGISYSSTSTVNSAYAIVNLVKNIKDVELIFFAGGTNDYGTDVEIGNADDTEDVSFYGALNIAFKTTKENNPNAKIYVLSPIPRLNEDKPNQKGYVLDDYRQALQLKAAENNFFFIDGSLLEIYPDREEDKNAYILDGTHLNEKGHEKLAQFIIKSIENK